MLLEAALRDLEHTDPRVRAQAADALGRVDDADRGAAVTALRARRRRRASVGALRRAALARRARRRRGGRRASAARLGDGEPLVREAAAIALGQLGDGGRRRAPGRALERALAVRASPRCAFKRSRRWPSSTPRAPRRWSRRCSTTATPRCARRPRPRSATPAIAAPRRSRSARLLDDAGDVRHEAALALARLGDRRAHAVAGGGARHRRSRARRRHRARRRSASATTARARARCRAARSTRFFGDALVKVRAAEALARAGDARGLEHLRKAARSPPRRRARLAQSVLSGVAAMAGPALIDSHCHLEPKDFVADGVDERPAVLERARAAGVEALRLRRLGQLARRGAQRRRHGRERTPTSGPRSASTRTTPRACPTARSTRSSGSPRRTRAWSPSARPGSTTITITRRATEQQEALRRFIAIARRAEASRCRCTSATRTPTPRASSREERADEVGGVIHCFTGTLADAQAYVALGFHVSLSGVVTFKSAEADPRGGRLGAARPAARRDRLPVPRARAAARKAQRARVSSRTRPRPSPQLRGLSLDEFGAATTRQLPRAVSAALTS